MLKGCIVYEEGEVSFFDKETVIDTSNILTLLHATLAKEAVSDRYRIEGKMPDDFHNKFVRAVRPPRRLSQRRK